MSMVRSGKFLILVLLFCFSFCTEAYSKVIGRKQWTEKQAWNWQKRVGIIKGFNQLEMAYPGMTEEQVMQKGAELGFNSVRIFVEGETAQEQIAHIRRVEALAAKSGMTLSPVLYAVRRGFSMADTPSAQKSVKAELQQIIGAFAHDGHILMWDICNEPTEYAGMDLEKQMRWIERAVTWCWEMNPEQPITASIFWDLKSSGYLDSPSVKMGLKRRIAVESLMDVHNFHYYDSGRDGGKGIAYMVDLLNQAGHRPLVCTEALARTVGGTIPRALSDFSRYHIHFFLFGLYASDMNWMVSWERNSYEAYGPTLHDLLHPDGEPYDNRELTWIRNFKFADKNEPANTEIERTDRWSKERAWCWMALGPVKGLNYSEALEKKTFDQQLVLAAQNGYNAVRIRFDMTEWATNESGFFASVDTLLRVAASHKMRVMPVLFSDTDCNRDNGQISNYVSHTIKRYGADGRILAWDLYEHPGEKCMDKTRLHALIRLLFATARYEFANQPLTSTPCLKVETFSPDFNPRKALTHGVRNGWNKLLYGGGSSADLCYLQWSLSDVLSFSSNQTPMQIGWLTSIAYRFGRPIFCTDWSARSEQEATSTLDQYASSHVYWFSNQLLPQHVVENFCFTPIITPFK